MCLCELDGSSVGCDWSTELGRGGGGGEKEERQGGVDRCLDNPGVSKTFSQAVKGGGTLARRS